MWALVLSLMLLVIFGCKNIDDDKKIADESKVNKSVYERPRENAEIVKNETSNDYLINQTVAIFVDKDTLSQITSEIEQYRQDIENELQAKVVLISEDWSTENKADPQIYDIKNKLEYLYENEGLVGAVFVGNIPMAWFDSQGALDGEETGDYVSDYWYMNLDGKFQDTDNDEMFNWKTNYHLEQESLPEIWVGRLKTPVGGAEGIALLKKYFDRNHKYRTKQLADNKKLLWFHTSALAEEDPRVTGGNLETWYKETGALDSVKWSKAWDEENIDIVFDGDDNMTERLVRATESYLQKLENNEYEFLAFSSHGTRHGHEYKVTFDDIKKVKPKIYFGIFASCSLGDYSVQDYIGGWYLFGGNGLVMFMRTVPSIATAPNIQSVYILVNGGGLNKGITFGEAFKYQVGSEAWQATSLLGDPTLKMRYD